MFNFGLAQDTSLAWLAAVEENSPQQMSYKPILEGFFVTYFSQTALFLLMTLLGFLSTTYRRGISVFRTHVRRAAHDWDL